MTGNCHSGTCATLIRREFRVSILVFRNNPRPVPALTQYPTHDSLVDLFATENPSPSLRRLRRLLTTYRDALKHLGVSHLSLSSLPLPETLDPSVPHRLPTRMRVFASIVLSTFACLIRLPFFLLPLLVHLPVYLFARYASSGALEEDQAQNKVAIGLVLALVTYAAFFAVACVLLWTSIPWGGAILVAIVGTIAFVAYHNRLVDANVGCPCCSRTCQGLRMTDLSNFPCPVPPLPATDDTLDSPDCTVDPRRPVRSVPLSPFRAPFPVSRPSSASLPSGIAVRTSSRWR